MIINLVYCHTCTMYDEEFLGTIGQLKETYQDDLHVVTVDCMAACDQAPAVMLEYDYVPKAKPRDLTRRVARLANSDQMLRKIAAGEHPLEVTFDEGTSATH